MNTNELFATIEAGLNTVSIAGEEAQAALATLRQRVTDLEAEHERIEQLFTVALNTLFDIKESSTTSRTTHDLIRGANAEMKSINDEFKANGT